MNLANTLELSTRSTRAGEVAFSLTGSSVDLSFTFGSDAQLSTRSDAGLVAALLPSMGSGRSLRVEGDVSQALMDRTDEIQEVLAGFIRGLERVPVSASRLVQEDPHLKRGTGAFFSLGLDSSYTLAERGDELTHLIFVSGFDPRPLGSGLWEALQRKAGEVAAALGKELIVVRSNVREVAASERMWRWFHGPALASVAHVLSPVLEKVYISSSWPYRALVPWGTHPALDPLWSSDLVNVVHFGARLSRSQKFHRVVNELPEALGWLRICNSTHDEFNCGRCSKCLRGMLVLDALGHLPTSRTFPTTVSMKSIRRMNSFRRDANLSTRLTLDYLEEEQLAPATQKALRRSLRRASHARWLLDTLPPGARRRLRRNRIFRAFV